MKKIAEKFHKRSILIDICIAIIINILLETMARGSLIKSFTYMANNPAQSVFNTLIILLPLAFTMFFRRRFFFTCIVSVAWLALGVTNLTLLTFRSTPFSAVDLRLISTAVDVFDVYLRSWQVVLIVAAVIMVVVLAVLLWIKAPKFEGKRNLAKALAFPAITVLGVVILNYSTAQAEEVSFSNLAEAYENYGFAYCFSVSVVDSGMGTPSNYSQDTIEEMVSSLSEDKQADSLPNIVYVQLESFFDINYVADLELSEDPIPTFQYLKENYTSGLLTVPCVGAGTANTEFEVLTGMSINFFGAGEYPFKTVMTTTTAESIAYDLSSLGYTTQAAHNHRGTFYGRNSVYANLGFDTFTPIEYMQNIVKTEKNWAKDEVLTDVIMGAMESTEEQDLMYAVSVQAHGQYPAAVNSTNLEIEAIGPEGSDKTPLEYYVQQIREVDQFLAELTAALEAYDEDVVLVLYGDHQPTLSYITDYDYGNRYTTEYVVWSNFGLEKQDKDLYAYQLSAYVQDLVGLNSGLITKYHQDKDYNNSEEYLDGLELLQYDMLYGKAYCYGEIGRYAATEMTFGINDITISNTYTMGDTLYVVGENFTKFSDIYIDGEAVDTEFISGGLLSAAVIDLQDGQQITIGQRNKDRVVMSYSDPFVYMATQEEIAPVEGTEVQGTEAQDAQVQEADEQETVVQ